jgi:squalene synthase HpnC
MTAADAARPPAKGHRDENFPVASFILRKPHRTAVMSFYRFARKADDVADDPAAAPADKLARLGAMQAALDGEAPADAEAFALRCAAERRGLPLVHARELLEAFRRDVVVRRYETFAALLDYCRYSAMPVGRFVLDVHGESRDLWPASDALCAALQIINHLQDCAKDYKSLDRVYLPLEDLAAAGCEVDALAAPKASAALLAVIHGLAGRTQGLLATARPFAAGIRDPRLAYEVAVIQTLAEDLTKTLLRKDPLSQRVKHRGDEAAALVVRAAAGAFLERRRARP